MINAAKLLVECLVKQGVKYIFAIPGAKIDMVFDELLDAPIRVIVCRHEQNAAFMAASYGRMTGKPGVVLVTSGPGVSNLATGLLTATTEGDPVVAIGGAVARSMKLKESHQNTNNIKLMTAVTKARFEILETENIPEIVENAFRQAIRPRSGAVFISVPQDVLKEETSTTANEPLPQFGYGKAPAAIIHQLQKILENAKLPVLLLGQEATRPENTAAIRQLLAKTPLPVVSTYQGAGVISRALLNCFVGRVGLFKNQPGDKLLDAADVVVTVGYNPVEYDPEVWQQTLTKKIIHLDYNPADIRFAYRPMLEVLGDIAMNILQLAEKLTLKNPLNKPLLRDLQQELQQKINQDKSHSSKLMHPLHFIHDLQQTIDDNTVVISDIGTHYMWLSRYFLCYEPHHLLFSNGQQTLGVALPWAIGVHFSEMNKKIISISGDGGFLFSAAELETAVREKVHFVHCVWCDNSYNMVKEQELLKYHRESSVELGSVDLVKFADSFGAHGFKVNHPDEFKGILQQAINLPGPVLIEVPIDYSDNLALFKSSLEGIHH